MRGRAARTSERVAPLPQPPPTRGGDFSLASLALAVALAGCGPTYSPDTYSTAAVQQANKVDKGVIIGVRPVDVSSSGVTGAAVGGAAGGALGANTPGGGVTSTLGAIGGGLVGGLIGTGVEHATADTTAFEYIVRKINPDAKAGVEMVSVTQKDDVPLPIGMHVLVIAGTQARIVRDYTVEPEPPVATLTPPPSPKPADAPPTPAPDATTTATAPPPPPVAASPLPSPLPAPLTGPLSLTPPAAPTNPAPSTDSAAAAKDAKAAEGAAIGASVPDPAAAPAPPVPMP